MVLSEWKIYVISTKTRFIWLDKSGSESSNLQLFVKPWALNSVCSSDTAWFYMNCNEQMTANLKFLMRPI